MEPNGIKLSATTFTKLKVHPLNLLKGVAKIIKDIATGATGGLANLPADVLDTINAFKAEDEPERVAWNLVSRSLADALIHLIVESDSMYDADAIETEPLKKSLDDYLQGKAYYLSSSFFNDPKSFELVDDIKPALKEYVQLFGFSAVEAENLLARLNSYFLFSLIQEWRSHLSYYSVLKESVRTPFDEAEKQEAQWAVYRSYLINEINKPVFASSFSLEQIYIPLRAYYRVKEKDRKEHQPNTTDRFAEKDSKQKRIVVDIEDHLAKWIKKGDPKDSIKVIQGGPGYGKSSFLKVFAAKLAQEGKRVLFVPLHRLDVDQKLDRCISEFIKYDKYFSHDLINESDERVILLFDGLDELSMQGKTLYDVAQSFIREVEKSVSNYNSKGKLRIQAILSGRDLVVEQNESDFRNEGQVLRLLPYFIHENERRNYTDTKNLLASDQRNEWWKKYGKVTGENFGGLPNNLNSREIDELTALPLLNFLVALSVKRDAIQFNEDTNLNEIYDDLLQAVHERSYSEGRRHQSISNIDYEPFGIILQEIAVAAWHGSGRTTTVNEIEAHFEESGLKELLDQFVQDAEKGVVSLLAAFYFRQAGKNVQGSQTFEFTHKSFGEYLAAKNIIGKTLDLHEQLTDREKEPFKKRGKGVDECLREWVVLFGKIVPDQDLIKFIDNELQLKIKSNAIDPEALQTTLVKLFNTALNTGMPVEKLHPRLTTKLELEQYRRSFISLLIMHSTVAATTQKTFSFVWKSATSPSEFLSLIRPDPNNDIGILDYFNGMDFSHASLARRALFRVNFHRAKLAYTSLLGAFLVGANLREVNLQGADIEDANLERADLRWADLRRANLNGANLQEARLEAANLSAANLRGANLSGAILHGAKLHSAVLQRADLKEAKLQWSDLHGADLSGASLNRAFLSGVNLQEARLTGADLKKASLVGADLTGTDLTGTDLTGTDLTGTDLRGAKYDEGALRQAADLTGTKT